MSNEDKHNTWERRKNRVGQNRIYTPYMTVYLVISLPKVPYIHRIYMVLANPKKEVCWRDDTNLVCLQVPPVLLRPLVFFHRILRGHKQDVYNVLRSPEAARMNTRFEHQVHFGRAHFKS